MSDTIQLMQQVAAQLQQEGKTPSLALFRARLAGQLAPQQLFTAYQHWRSNPVFASEINRVTPPTPVTEEVTDDLAATLARIEAKLDKLLSKLDN
ncbi:hypothetical protein ORJ04_08045 [Rheinheimera baltica]|uniref:KfrA N-terminal DNA-binding domain-containing protein n=1 Tax=Rheinheimera baltica TaxID=67576 RepID=A0ABT9HXN7_9GAMM|nr:hypothetical protein [Rheinheimera baltica]MDP5135896.1 hypothetical protein [Rheinheimera baltica]